MSWLPVVPGVIVLALDLVVASPWAGAVAAGGMLATFAWLARSSIRPGFWRGLVRHASALARLRAALLLALAGVLAARVFIAVRHLGHAGPETLAAGRTYDVLFVALAACEAVAVSFGRQTSSLLVAISRRPAMALASSFGLLIGTTTLLLTLPVSVRRVADVSLIDALFTSTSVVCVTGLTVNDVGATYTAFGQVVLLAAMQLGGIGIMTLAALALTWGPGSELGRQSRYAAMLETRTLRDLRVLVRSVVTSTLAIEAIGAIALGLLWWDDPRLEGRSLAWTAVFHSVAAFCNAGVSLFSTNLIDFRDHLGAQAVMMTLIVLGGLGFPALREIGGRLAARVGRAFRARGPLPSPASLGTRAAVLTSAILVVTGFAAISVLESNAALGDMGIIERLTTALFTSVTARTAGFNTVDIGTLRPATLLVIMLLMFVGGSPSSTAGGIKTTTLAVIVAAVNAELRGREPRLLGRTLAAEVLRRATTVATVCLATVFLSLLGLSLTERHDLLALSFEAVSAFGTVGLSTGITASLSTAGKLILILTMFAGRVGPLTVALAVSGSTARAAHRPALEDLPVG